MTGKILTKNRKGFTLVELMIVVVLIAISVGVTGDVLTSLVRSYNKTQITTEIEQQANFLKLKMEKELRGATGISSTGSPAGSTLTFTNSSSETITYQVFQPTGNSGYVVQRTVGSGDPEWVTSNIVPGGANIYCSTFGGNLGIECGQCFTATTNASNVTTVDICLVMRQASGSVGSSFTGKSVLKTTIVSRATY